MASEHAFQNNAGIFYLHIYANYNIQATSYCLRNQGRHATRPVGLGWGYVKLSNWSEHDQSP